MFGRTRHLSKHITALTYRYVVPCVKQSTTVSIPVPDGQDQPASPKIQQLVSEISKLTLLEVAELSGALKRALNLPDAPAAFMATQAMAVPAAEEEEEAPKKVQTSFTVKLLKFDETKKVAIIKEVKNLMEGMNLVQAKKFVESAPTIVKADIGKEEADKLAEALNKAGATCEVQ